MKRVWLLICVLLLLGMAAAAALAEDSFAKEITVSFGPGLSGTDASSTHTTGSSTGVQTSNVIPFTAEVSRTSARLRASAGTRAGLILTLQMGDQVTVVGQTTGTDGKVWYQVQTGVYTGYIRYDQLQVICGTAQLGAGAAEVSSFCEGKTNTRAVNVRLGMSTSTARVRLLRRGQKITIIGMTRDYYGVPWYYVRVPTGALGYIRGEFVTVTLGTVSEPAPLIISAVPAPAPTPLPAASDPQETELIYLRWISSHMNELQAIGDGYQGYSLFDMDGDGIEEILIDCSAEKYSLWKICTCVDEEVVDLGQLSADGYYLARPGCGLLLIQVLSDVQTQYTRMEKVGDTVVPIYLLLRTADEAWQYSWTYNQKAISEESLCTMLSEFTDDVLQNMGLFHGSHTVSAPDEPAVTMVPVVPYGYSGGNG